MATYVTHFNLVYPVIDYEAARDYLSKDKIDNVSTTELMTQVLKEHMSFGEKIDMIEWVLQTEERGYIILETNASLSKEELAQVSRWVQGQNSDGLGEGFEQQEFACYYYNESTGESVSESAIDMDESDLLDGLDDQELEYYDREAYYTYIMASFDWMTNDYTFTLEK
jgi:hypothetical protein